MKSSVTYSISLKVFLPRIILVTVLVAIAPVYDDHADRFITVGLMMFGFVLLVWISSMSLAVKINEASLHGPVLSIPLPIVRTKVIAWDDIESVTIMSWYGIKFYRVATKNSLTSSVSITVHLKDKQDFKMKVESFSGKDSPLSRVLRDT